MKLSFNRFYPYLVWVTSIILSAVIICTEDSHIFSHNRIDSIVPAALLNFLFSLPLIAVISIAYFLADGVRTSPLAVKAVFIFICLAYTFTFFYLIDFPLMFYFAYGFGITLPGLIFKVSSGREDTALV